MPNIIIFWLLSRLWTVRYSCMHHFQDRFIWIQVDPYLRTQQRIKKNNKTIYGISIWNFFPNCIYENTKQKMSKIIIIFLWNRLNRFFCEVYANWPINKNISETSFEIHIFSQWSSICEHTSKFNPHSWNN